jgi:hypothetical protein
MSIKDISFSLNLYDDEGDMFERGILIHIDNNLILKFDNMIELNFMIDKLTHIRKEIYEIIGER